jgi:hypothetical protein
LIDVRRPYLPAMLVLLALLPAAAWAHDISAANKAFVEAMTGPAPIPFAYLGAKHMVTGIDHVLYLIGVVFFLHKLRDVMLYVSLFALGHSLTLIGGVLLKTGANSHIVDAIIGFSVIYKAFENLGGFEKLRFRIDSRAAVLAFGLAHGLGLATKLQGLAVSESGLLVNLLSFNVGVEIGQVLVLVVVVFLLNLWRRLPSFDKGAFGANCVLMAAGALLACQQIAEYLAS